MPGAENGSYYIAPGMHPIPEAPFDEPQSLFSSSAWVAPTILRARREFSVIF
jgi:hypothetical protein